MSTPEQLEHAGEDPTAPEPIQGGRAAGTRGLLLALGVLVAVLALAALAYGLLLGQASGNGGPSSTVSAEPSGSEPSGDARAMWLADYDCTVYADKDVPLTLTQIADGRPLVVNFWATWCPYCLQEMPDYQKIYDEYGDRVAFAFVDATDGQRETMEAARDWMAGNGYTVPVYYDLDRDAVRTFGLRSYPTTVVVAASGEVMAVSPGVIDPALMRSALDSLLEG